MCPNNTTFEYLEDLLWCRGERERERERMENGNEEEREDVIV